MHADVLDHANDPAATAEDAERRRYGLSAGLICSIVLHGLALTVLIVVLVVAARPNDVPLVIPINIVELADQTASPVQAVKAVVPLRQTGAPASPSAKPVAVSPTQTRPLPDKLEVKLRELAQLREPVLDTRVAKNGEGLARLSATSAGAELNSHSTVEDFLRAQIEHHWTPDLAALHGRNISLMLRLAITSTGVVTRAEVVNHPDVGLDQAYDEAALSARNAALLASPLTLPPGNYAKAMDVVLTLNTADSLH